MKQKNEIQSQIRFKMLYPPVTQTMMNFLMNYWPKIMIDLALSVFSIP